MSEIAETLSRSGVGNRYHKMTLSEFGKSGANLRQWIDSDMELDIQNGKGIWVHGATYRSRDLLIVLARGMILKVAADNAGQHANAAILQGPLARELGHSWPEEAVEGESDQEDADADAKSRCRQGVQEHDAQRNANQGPHDQRCEAPPSDRPPTSFVCRVVLRHRYNISESLGRGLDSFRFAHNELGAVRTPLVIQTNRLARELPAG